MRYRGAIGQWSWVLHRLTGLGVVLFLFLHVIDTSWAVFAPESYEHAIAAYQSPLFTIGEFGLVFAVVYHAFNGLRIAVFDFKPEWWKYQQQAAYWVLGATAIVLVPVFIGMFGHVAAHYFGDETPFILPITTVLIDQLPFVVFMIGGAVAALVASYIVGMVRGDDEQAMNAGVSTGSNIEKFWWSFMRVSAILIVPLVFGHLAMMHVIQGVFDLTVAGGSVVGVDAPNVSGTATEFVALRWSMTGIKIYDGALLILVTMHGFNGLRYVLTDYTNNNPLLRRAAGYLTLMGGVALIVVGLAALMGTIDQSMIDAAKESLDALQGGVGH